MVSDRHSKESKTNFDNDWYCCSISSTSEHTDVNQIFDEKHQWTAVQLPHVIDHTDENNWWYRKRFEWRTGHQGQLVFQSSNDDSSSTHTLTVWLNDKQIFSGTVQRPTTTIDMTDQLTHKNNPSEENTLVVCCCGTSLALHVYLLENGRMEADMKAKASSPLPFLKNRVLDYVVGFNDAEGLFNVDWNPKLAKPSNTRNEESATASSTTSGVLQYLARPTNRSNPPAIIVNDNAEPTDTDENSRESFRVPRLSIVMLIVGTRGDVQPFIAFGGKLRSAGHRVRLATHESFRETVSKHGLEFYPLGSNPDDLMSFMVKNGGVFPKLTSVFEGDLKKRRHDINSILQSTWLACTANDDQTSAPFTAEVIIANPPSLGHFHCAQKLQIPLHMVFTMPWSSTSRFPHALAKLDYSKAPREKLNLISYDALEAFTWSSMHDIVNKFRQETLGLPPLHVRQAVRMLIDERVPYTYCWSPSLVPAPDDWPSHIGVSGFFFLDNDDKPYKPAKRLARFLGLAHNDDEQKKLPPPIYIGFGSITGNDPDHLLKIVLDALEETGYRAVISGFEKSEIELPDDVLRISDVPHDWLFQHVSAVCHHGGAGTTAAGLRAGRPTVIVPFFGDQFFWGSIVEKTGAGPRPLPGKTVTAKELAKAFKAAHQSDMQTAAERIREAISREDGCTTAMHMFHSHLPLARMYSDLEPTFTACYRVEDFDLQVSRSVAQVLVATGALDESQFSPHATREWPGIYDSRVHVPTSGLVKHTSKAFSHVFVHTADDMRRAVSEGNMLTGAVTGLGAVCKDVGKGAGQLSLGVLSLYGELTDVLERAPICYDRYDEVGIHERPLVTDLRSGARAAGHSIVDGWKDGLTGFKRKPRVGYHRHGLLGGTGGVLVAAANGLVKPTVGSLASVTWLSRGVYADIKKRRQRKGRTTQTDEKHILINEPSTHSANSSASSTDGNETEQEDDDASRSIKFAAVVSGYPAEVCQHILDEFEKVKRRQEKIAAATPSPTTQHRRKGHLRRSRRHSDSAL